MGQFFQIHAENPQARLVKQAVDIIRAGGVVVYPTDSSYALGCKLGDKAALDPFRLLKAHTPGPYTFILDATREVPRMLLHPKRRTIGLRVPANPIAQALLAELGEPLMSVTLILPGDQEALNDPYEIRERLEKLVDLIIDGGYGGLEPSTVVSLVDGDPQVLREGCGDPQPFRVQA